MPIADSCWRLSYSLFSASLLMLLSPILRWRASLQQSSRVITTAVWQREPWINIKDWCWLDQRGISRQIGKKSRIFLNNSEIVKGKPVIRPPDCVIAEADVKEVINSPMVSMDSRLKYGDSCSSAAHFLQPLTRLPHTALPTWESSIWGPSDWLVL